MAMAETDEHTFLFQDRTSNSGTKLTLRLGDIEDEVETYLKEQLSLKEVIQKLEKKCCRKLTNQDCLRVEDVYVDHIVSLWIDEGEKRINNLFDEKNPWKVLEIITTISSFSTCHELFGNSSSYNVLIYELSETSKELKSREKKSIFKLKERCHASILKIAKGIEYDIIFYESFAVVMKSSLNIPQFCESLNIFSFIFDDNFKHFLLNLIENQYSCPNLINLQQSAKKILMKDNFIFLSASLKKLVIDYLKPVKMNECKVDGRQLLEISGKHIVLSKELDKITSHFSFSLVEEVRFVNAGVVHVDASLEKSTWHGKNIVVHAETLIVSVEKQVVWDVSGKDADETVTGVAPSRSVEGYGLNGENGNPGESGGNVCLIVQNVENGENFKIVSNGGNGSKGQNGGCGENGSDGQFIDEYSFKKDFPPVSNMQYKAKNYQETIVSVLKNVASVDRCHYGLSEFNVSKDQFVSITLNENLRDIYFETTTKEGCQIKFSFKNEGLFNCCQSFLLYQGALGEIGKAGGAGGLGGTGGSYGVIDIQCAQKSDHFISTRAENGDDGEMGIPGKSGISGKNGLDRGYMDCTLAIFHNFFSSVSWPRYFIPGPNDNIKLTVKFYDQMSSKRVICPLNNRYAEITPIRRDEQLIQQHHLEQEIEEQTNIKNRANVTRKKNISAESIMEQYKAKDSEFRLTNFMDIVEKYNEALDKSMSEETTQSEKVTEVVKITRKICYENDWFMDKTNQGKLQKRTRKNNKLRRGNVNGSASSRAYVYSNSVPETIAKSGSGRKHLRTECADGLSRAVILPTFNVSFKQYCLDKLIFINAISLENSFENISDVELQMTNARCLDEPHSNVNHCKQGTTSPIETFLCEDNFSSRKKVYEICQSYDIDRKPLQEALKTFIFESKNEDTCAIMYNALNDFQLSKKIKLKEKLTPLKYLIDKKSQNKHLHKYLLDSILKQCAKSQMKFENEIFQDKFLSKLYSSYVAELKKEFDWDVFEIHLKPILSLFFESIKEHGPFTLYFREFLAYHFDKNILLYKLSGNDGGMILESNHNPNAKCKIHFLLKSKKFVKLNFNHDLARLFEKSNLHRNLFGKIMFKFCSFTEMEQVNDYMSKESFTTSSTLTRSDVIEMKIKHIINQEKYINTISNFYSSKQDSNLVRCRLEKLKSDFIGYESILHYMALHFEVEGNRTTIDELCLIINLILMFSTEELEVMSQVSWIMAVQPQQCWLVELALLKCELYLKRPLKHDIKFQWRHYVKEPTEKERLIMFLKKLDCEANCLSVEGMGEILELMSNVPKAHIGLEHINIGEWKYYLTDRVWAHRMSLISDWTEEELKILSFYLVSLENSIGNELCLSLVRTISKATEMKSNEDKDLVLNILKRLYSKEVCINVQLCKKLSLRPMKEWLQVIDEESFSSGSHRTLPQLIKLIENSEIVSENIKRILPKVKHNLDTNDQIITFLKDKNVSCEKNLKDLFSTFSNSPNNSLLESIGCFLKKVTPDENTFKTIISLFKQLLQPSAYSGDLLTPSKLIPTSRIRGQSISPYPDVFSFGSNILPLIELAIKLKLDISLRNTQKLTVLTLLKNVNGTLAQVNTGEGKSLIVVTVSIIRALYNEKVNIVTSSKVLAERDALKYESIFKLCGVTVGHNCSENISDRKKVYSNCQVIYGDLANFQRDYLLDRAYDKNILGDSSFQTVIVDEVDSLLLDKGNNVLYLSHDIPGLDTLEPLFIYIWKLICRPIYQDQIENILAIKQKVIYDLFGVVSKEDLKRLDTSISEEQIVNTWNYLLVRDVIHPSGKVMKISVSDCNFEDLPENCISKAHLEFIFHKIISRERVLSIPNCLKQFVEDHLDSWIKSGINAMIMENSRDYIVDVDRSGTSADRDSIITILDRDTGTDLYNSQWDEALHQFLQLKHGCKLSLMTLKAVFISNVAFLTQYKVLYGLTGTLGTKYDRELLQEVYRVDFVKIPTSKTKKFYEEPAILCSSTEEWKQKIGEEVYKVLDKKRSALIICESIRDVEVLKDFFSLKLSTEHDLFTYTRDYEQFVTEELQPGKIVISTNLAGRGTDIKLSNELIANGGLFVCLSFLPSSCRVEEQAYGRAARNGEPGSAQLIFRSIRQSAYHTAAKIIDYRDQRNKNEIKRISVIKSFYENQIKPQEKWFGKFCNLYKDLKKMKQKNEIRVVLLEAYLNQWAFWLDQNEKRLISNTRTEEIFISLDCFITDWRKLGSEDIMNWLHLIKDPIQLVKLGLVYLEQKNSESSLLMFNKVLKEEPNFSATARYYKICIESKPQQENEEILNCFKTTAKQVKDRAESLLLSSVEIEWLKEQDNVNVIQINSFSDQQRNIGKIYDAILNSIYSIIGFEVYPHSFVLPNQENPQNMCIDFNMSEDIYNNLKERELISKPLIKSNILEDDLLFVRDYGLSPSQMSEFIKPLQGEVFIEYQFLESLKKKFPVPCRELFWEELIKSQILTDEEDYIFIHMQKLKTVHPSLYQKIKSQSAQECLKPTNKLWLYQPEELIQAEHNEEHLFLKLGQFSGLMGPNITQTEWLINKHLIVYNKLAAFSSRKNISFERFDSICIEDFQLVNICKKTALEIIEDLISQQIIKEKSKERHGCYYLLIEAKNIEKIELQNLKAYTCEVISLMSVCFAFRITFEKLYLLNDNSDESICIPLPIRQYERIVLDFREKEIISKTYVPVTGNISELDAIYLQYMDRDGYKRILARVLSDSNCDSLIDRMIKDGWLIANSCKFQQTKYIINDKINTKKNDKKQNPIQLPDNFETALVALGNHLNLVQNLNHIKTVLSTCKGQYVTVEDPQFVLTPLLDELPQQELASEIDRFSLNGFDQLIVLQEKKWSLGTMCRIGAVAAFGICQITIGVTSMFFLPPNVAGALVSEGMNDLIFAVSCMITGYFDLKDYFLNKALSMMITFLNAGFKSLFQSNFGRRFKPFFSKKPVPKTSTMIKSVAKVSSITIVTAVTQGLAFASLDYLIEPQLLKLSDTLTTSFSSNIRDTLNNHSIKSCIEEFCSRPDRDLASSRIALQQLFNTRTTQFIEKFCKSLQSTYWSIEFLIMKSFKTLFKHKSTNKAQFCLDISLMFFEVLKLINESKSLFESVEGQIISCLDVIEKDLKDLMKKDEQNKMPTAKIHHFSKQDKDDFTKAVFKDWEEHWQNLLSNSFKRFVLSPLIYSITNFIIDTSSKYMFDKTKDLMKTDDTFQRNASFYKDFKSTNKKSKSSNPNSDEYERCLLDLLKKKRNVAVYVEIMRKNLPIDTHYIEMCCFILPKALESMGITIPNLDIIVERNGTNHLFSTSMKQNGKLTITIAPESDLFTNLKKNQTLIHNGVNMILDKLVQQYPELQVCSRAVFRRFVASKVEAVFGTQPSFPTVPYNPLLSSNSCKYKPTIQYRLPRKRIKFGESWSYNMNVNVELLTEEKVSSIKKYEDHIYKGFRLALEKINTHICRVQGHFRNFKLVIEDFDPSNYKIVPQTSKEMLHNFDCFPTHYELVLPFVVDCNKFSLETFKVTMSLSNYDGGSNPKRPCDPFITYEVCPKVRTKYLNKGTKGYILLNKDCSEPRFTVEDCRAAGELILPMSGCQLQRRFRALILGVSMLKPSEFKVTSHPDFVALSFPKIVQLKSAISILAKIYKGVDYVVLIPGPSMLQSRQREEEVQSEVADTVDMINFEFGNVKVVVCSFLKSKKVSFEKVVETNRCLNKYVSAQKSDLLVFLRIHKLLTADVFNKNQRYLDKNCFAQILNFTFITQDS